MTCGRLVHALKLTHATAVFCRQAIGKPHSLWCAFAKFYEKHGDVANARIIFDKATEVRHWLRHPRGLEVGTATCASDVYPAYCVLSK